MNRLKRTIFVFVIITAFTGVAGLIYHHFGRGVFSWYMAHAFYYPLFLGVLFNLLLLFIQKRIPFVGTVGYRLYSNIYNTGIGALTIHSFIMGVLEIALGESDLIGYFLYFGWACVGVGLCILQILLIRCEIVLKRHKASLAAHARRSNRGE